jgi:hypothetical protein
MRALSPAEWQKNFKTDVMSAILSERDQSCSVSKAELDSQTSEQVTSEQQIKISVCYPIEARIDTFDGACGQSCFAFHSVCESCSASAGVCCGVRWMRDVALHFAIPCLFAVLRLLLRSRRPRTTRKSNTCLH